MDMNNDKKKQLLEEAKQWIASYLEREYGDTWDVDFSDLTHISLKFVDSDDDLSYTEAAIDLVHCCVDTYIGDYVDGKAFHIRKINFLNIEELVNALPRLDIERLAQMSKEEVEELDTKLMAAFERSMVTGRSFKSPAKCLEQDWKEYIK